MYRHDSHTQALMSLNVPAVMAVAPSSVDFSVPEHLDDVRAFVLEPLDAFVLSRAPGTGARSRAEPEPVRLLNVQGARYAEDNASVDLGARAGARLEIIT